MAQQPGQRRNVGAEGSIYRNSTASSAVLKLCPYCLDMFRCSNFASHLIVCRNKNPKNLVEFVICPHDYSHHVRSADFKGHLDVCEARGRVNAQQIKAGHGHFDEQIKELKEKLNHLEPELERRKRQALIPEKGTIDPDV